MVTITSSHTVVPNESTPEGYLWLPEMDQVAILFYTRTIYVYKAKDNYDAIERLKKSLSEILVLYYPMAGRLFWRENGRIELNLNAKGVVLLEAETTQTMADFGDFAPSDSTKELVPTVDYNQPIEHLPLLVVQLTRFHNNGGLAIGVALFHSLADGLAATQFINSWAKIARGETLEPNEIPFLDRTILKIPYPPKERHVEDYLVLKPLPLIQGRSDNTEERNKKTAAILLRLSAEQVEKLKKKANESDIKKGWKPYSKYEAIGAHLWRCAVKAHELQENQVTLVRFNADVRSRMIPPLPKNYFGNALAQTATSGYVGEITSKPLGYVAEKIREAKELINDEYIRSHIDIIRCMEHLEDARALFFNEGKHNPYFGNPNFHLTSWMSMPAYETDFGWGKPFYFGLVDVSRHERAIMLLSPDGDGSVIVCLHFQIAHLENFKRFFYEDI